MFGHQPLGVAESSPMGVCGSGCPGGLWSWGPTETQDKMLLAMGM